MGLKHFFKKAEEGATAVLLTILLLGALLPLAAIGLSSYVRTGTSDELQRSADAGALAGARLIPLGNPEFVRAYLAAAASPGSLIPTFGGVDPLAEACARARTALIEDSTLGEDYADPTAAICEASYTGDSGVLGDLASCLEQLALPVGTIPPQEFDIELPGVPELPELPGGVAGRVQGQVVPTPPPLPTPPPVEPDPEPTTPVPLPTITPLPTPSPTLPEVPDSIHIEIDAQQIANLLYQQLGSVLPALLKPGIQVTLTRTFEGAPLDGLIAGDEVESGESATATARRRFKNAIVVPIVETPPLVIDVEEQTIPIPGVGDIPLGSGTEVSIDGQAIDLNPALEENWDDVSDLVSTLSDNMDLLLEELAHPEVSSGDIVLPLPGGGTVTVSVTASVVPPINLECQLAIKRFLEDLDDIYSPGVGNPPTQQEIIQEAGASGEMIYAFILGQDPANPTTTLPFGQLAEAGWLGIPFFDFVPVCISGDEALVTTEDIGCATGARGGFRASLVPNT